MRNGWDDDDIYMLISAGITPQKPDHQHGDMLGVQAFAFGNTVLPNYQVRYYLNDLEEFKNSWVKNVVLLDSVPQGREWEGNKGGSGFGKFGKLPTPKVLAWKNTNDFDLFVGSHDGNEQLGTKTYRSVIFIKDGFWIVSDKLIANNAQHTTQQVWQGHYDVEKQGQHIRSVFPNGAGLEIIQLNGAANKITKTSVRGKGRSSFEKSFENETTWRTLLFPFKDFEERLVVEDYNTFKADDWKVVSTENSPVKTDAKQIIYNKTNYLLLGVTEVIVNGKTIACQESDLWVKVQKNEIEITNCGVQGIEINNKGVKAGESIKL
jgi:hypothetical protein